MKLIYGTEEEHRATLERAKKAGVDYVWSGQLRSDYLRENLRFGCENKLLTAKWIEREQESGWNITWL